MLCWFHSCGLKNSVISTSIDERGVHGPMLPGHVYIYCTNLSERQLKLIAETGGKISISMESNMQMGMGIPPVRACIEHGIKPSLSIDTSTAIARTYFLRCGWTCKRIDAWITSFSQQM
jgi:hypothetical protein